MGMVKPWHILVLVVVVLLVFGTKKLPDMARSVGRSMRVFKTEVDELKSENDDRKKKDSDSDEEPESSAKPKDQSNGAQPSDAQSESSRSSTPQTAEPESGTRINGEPPTTKA